MRDTFVGKDPRCTVCTVEAADLCALATRRRINSERSFLPRHAACTWFGFGFGFGFGLGLELGLGLRLGLG